MNELHLTFLASPAWAQALEEELLPWLIAAGDLGDDVLELGPGPGLTTDMLLRLGSRVTALEVDPALAGSLSERLADQPVTVLCRDATDTGLEAGRFSSVVCFSMLHHVPTAAMQDEVFSESARVLRPGGRLLVVDALDTPDLRAGHVDDTFVPLDPSTVRSRLERAGFAKVEYEITDTRIRIQASKS